MNRFLFFQLFVLVLIGACAPAPTALPPASPPLTQVAPTLAPPAATATSVPPTQTPAIVWQGFVYDGKYTIEVDKPTALTDEPIKIRVTGLVAKQPITLRAKTTDQKNQVWESTATFAADSSGVVDVTSAAPISGSYLKPDGMGLFWSMLPIGAKNPESVMFSWATVEPTIVTLTAEAQDRTLATVELKRQRMLEDKVTRLSVRVDGVVGTFFYPSAPGKYPVVIVLDGSQGGLSESRSRLLASRGYASLALAYFAYETLPKELVEIPLEYFAKAIAWIKTQPAVNGDRIMVIGTSKGAELALLLGATYPQDIKGVIGYVPSAVVYRGLDNGPAARSSWTLVGKPVPFLDFDLSAECMTLASKKPGVFNCMYGKALDNTAAAAAASIAVEKINGPVLLISGSADQVWTSPRNCEMVVTRLKANSFAFAYEHLNYQGAGHYIDLPYFPASMTQAFGIDLGGSAEANGTASADAYAKVLGFLGKYLK